MRSWNSLRFATSAQFRLGVTRRAGPDLQRLWVDALKEGVEPFYAPRVSHRNYWKTVQIKPAIVNRAGGYGRTPRID